MSWFRAYQHAVKTRPILTQSITTACLFGTGDVIAQQAVEKTGWNNHNYARTGRMALYGGAVFGPAATVWFRFLSQRVKIPGRPNLEIAARVGMDQCIFATCNLFCFLSSMAIMEGTDPKKKLEQSYLTALSRNWMLWPPVQAFNFKFVPLEWRVMIVNVVSIGWNCYLSYVNSGGGGGGGDGGAKEKKEEDEPPFG